MIKFITVPFYFLPRPVCSSLLGPNTISLLYIFKELNTKELLMIIMMMIIIIIIITIITKYYTFVPLTVL